MEKTKATPKIVPNSKEVTELPEEGCHNCRFLGQMVGDNPNKPVICRRYPPRIFAQIFMTDRGPMPQTVTAWPGVSAGESCGEWQERKIDSRHN